VDCPTAQYFAPALSACDTGQGEPNAEEGVMGLRRGFLEGGYGREAAINPHKEQLRRFQEGRALQVELKQTVGAAATSEDEKLRSGVIAESVPKRTLRVQALFRASISPQNVERPDPVWSATAGRWPVIGRLRACATFYVAFGTFVGLAPRSKNCVNSFQKAKQRRSWQLSQSPMSPTPNMLYRLP
jgi:hypothetical protein